MENNIITLKEKELDKAFRENENSYGLIISMFSLERLWIPFVFATSIREWDVQSKVRQCMDLMWDRIFEEESSTSKKSDFINLLDTITDCYTEDDSNNINYNYSFDNYLINALYSNIGYFFDDSMSEGYRIRTSASMAVLELLSDYIVDKKEIKSEESFQSNINEESLILSELKRIDKDLIFTKNNGKNIKKIKELKDFYKNFEILPIKSLELKLSN
jgi:hypothetical protein